MTTPVSPPESTIPPHLQTLYAQATSSSKSIERFFGNIHHNHIPEPTEGNLISLTEQSGRWVAEISCSGNEILRVECKIGDEIYATQGTQSESWLKLHFSLKNGELEYLFDQRNGLMYLGTAHDDHETRAQELLLRHLDEIKRQLQLIQ